MELSVVQRARVAGFDYVLVGRGTGCVMCDQERIDAGGLRSLLAASERDQQRTGFVLRQTAWYLPRVAWVDDPFDIGAACVSYLQRHPRLETAYVVAPTEGLIRMVLDFVAQRLPRLDTRITSDPAAITTALRAVEPDLPIHWYRLSVYPEAGGRVSSVMPAAAPVPDLRAGSIPRAPLLPSLDKPPRK